MFLNIASVTTLCLVLAYTGWEPTHTPIENISLDIGLQTLSLETTDSTWKDQILTWIQIYPDETMDDEEWRMEDEENSDKHFTNVSVNIDEDNTTTDNITRYQPRLIPRGKGLFNETCGNTLVWKLKKTEQVPTTTDGIEEAKALGYYPGGREKESEGLSDDSWELGHLFSTNATLDEDSMLTKGIYLIEFDHAQFIHLRTPYTCTTPYMASHGTVTYISDILTGNSGHFEGQETAIKDGDNDDTWVFTLVKIYMAGIILQYKITKIFGRKDQVQGHKNKKSNRRRRKRKQKTTGLSKYLGFLNISSLFY